MAVRAEALARDKKLEENGASKDRRLERGLPKVWERLEQITELDDLGYAHRDLFKLNEALTACFRKADVLVTPALPCDAFSSETSDLARTLSDGKTAFSAPW